MGDGEFVEKALAQAEEKFECKYHLKAKGFDFEKVVDRVAELTGREPAEVLALGRRKKGIATRSILCSWAMRELGISQTQLARVLRISQPAVSIPEANDWPKIINSRK